MKMKPDKEMIIGLLKQQLEAENEEIEQDIFDDPDGWATSQENTAELVIAIVLLERHDWTLGEDE